MNADSYQRELEHKRKQRIDAVRKASDWRAKESEARAAAAAARTAAWSSSSRSTVEWKAREADRRERQAAAAGKEANRWDSKAAGYLKEEAALEGRLGRARASEAAAVERRRKREEQSATRRTAAVRELLEQRLVETETAVTRAMRELRAPKVEKLRVLLLGASSDGELRVGREQQRIRNAVQSAEHRDLVELDSRPAATIADLLDGITRFRPHVVHFSGHSNEDVILFEDDHDALHDGVAVTPRAFAKAVRATDEPPLLVLLNSCGSVGQAEALAQGVVPFAIGMADDIEDGDAIAYAAQFYAAVANGQSIASAHLSAQAALELAGLDGADMPTLVSAPDVDPARTVLVRPAGTSDAPLDG